MAEVDRGPLAPEVRAVPAILARQAARFGDRPFMRCGERAWSHADACVIAMRMASVLTECGIGRGDRVALMCGNRAEFLESCLGCGWLGAVIVPINTASMGPQIEYFLANSEARLLVIERRFIERLAQIDRNLMGRVTIRVIEDIGLEAGVIARPAAEFGAVSASIAPGDPLAILYTSGTTGPAKGVIVSHAQYYWWGVNSIAVLGIDETDVLCTTLPLFHINAFNTFVQAALAGCEVVYESRFSASGFWPSMTANRATVIYVLGAMVPMLLAQPESAIERAHRVRIGLGPGVPQEAMATFRARTDVPLLEGYGSTETNFTIATSPDRARPGSMGWLRPGFSARVADDEDNEVADGTPGELLLRADEPYAFASGYFNMPQKTVEAWRNLWFHTGDRVVREADGAYRFLDRIKDAIRRRGENISSYEVEAVLLTHPRVAAVAVFPVRSELAEDEVMAAVIAREGEAVDPAELTRYCETRLPAFAIPRYVDVLDDLPRTESGKIRKFLLRERGVGERTWDRSKAER